jgi:hypothetical protein
MTWAEYFKGVRSESAAEKCGQLSPKAIDGNQHPCHMANGHDNLHNTSFKMNDDYWVYAWDDGATATQRYEYYDSCAQCDSGGVCHGHMCDGPGCVCEAK